MIRLLPWLKGQIQFLKLRAARNSDPTLYADFLLDNVPDGVDVAQLTNFLARDDWWSMLTMFASDVAPYEQWFTELRNEILAAMQESTAPASADPLPSGPDKVWQFQDTTAHATQPSEIESEITTEIQAATPIVDPLTPNQ